MAYGLTNNVHDQTGERIAIRTIFMVILTRTYHRSVFTMCTIVFTPFSVRTVLNETLNTKASHIVQPDAATSLTKPSIMRSTYSVRETKLTTYNLSVFYIPFVVANSSPRVPVKYLNSSFSIPVSTNKSRVIYKRIINDRTSFTRFVSPRDG